MRTARGIGAVYTAPCGILKVVAPLYNAAVRIIAGNAAVKLIAVHSAGAVAVCNLRALAKALSCNTAAVGASRFYLACAVAVCDRSCVVLSHNTAGIACVRGYISVIRALRYIRLKVKACNAARLALGTLYLTCIIAFCDKTFRAVRPCVLTDNTACIFIACYIGEVFAVFNRSDIYAGYRRRMLAAREGAAFVNSKIFNIAVFADIAE